MTRSLMPVFRSQALHQYILYTRRSTIARTYLSSQKPQPSADETSIASAKHKPSLSGPSLGHLLTELSPTTPEMLKAGLRVEGHTMNEEHRTLARKVTMGILGLPLALGSLTVVGAWLWPSASDTDY